MHMEYLVDEASPHVHQTQTEAYKIGSRGYTKSPQEDAQE
jgi:hypothetical protein